MRRSQITGGAIAAFFTLTTLAFAQTEPVQAQSKSSDGPIQTFTGCLMTERDFRSAHNLGAGTVGGAGLGNEYVLVDVKVSPAKGAVATAASDTSAVSATSSTASTKCADQGTAYRLTGPNEEQVKNLVGRQVEIQGRFKDPTDAREGEKMPNEVVLVSFREAPAPEAVSEPAAPPPPVQAAPPPPPPVQTAPPPPPPVQTAPPVPVQSEPAMATRTELPRTASSTGVFALIGVLALCSGLALTVLRRRVA